MGQRPDMSDDAVWEQKAEWWRDTFAGGDDPEYEEQILPLVREHLGNAQRVLDVGTGEGQVARTAVQNGASFVIGIDRSSAMLDEAVARDGGVHFLQADVSHLPFAGESFDAVTVSLVLEHVEELSESISEIARVLKPGGRFLLFINHPLLQTPNSGWIDDHILEEQYWRIGPYLTEDRTMEEVEPGVVIPFLHRPLSTYINLLAANGLYVTNMVEPAPPPGFIAQADEYADAATIPRLLLLHTQKL
jgi:SAM-dependent methyltransferase